jgi:signal transduction histidine kinase
MRSGIVQLQQLSSLTRLRSGWRRFRTLDPLLLDGLLAAALAAVSGVLFVREAPGELAGLALVVAAPLPLVLRRRHPRLTWALIVLLTAAALRPPTIAGFAAVVVAVYSVGAHGEGRLRSLAMLVVTAVALQVAVPEARPPLPDWSLNPLLIVGLWLAGDAVRGLQERAARLERERELAARIAVADERSRIARELHDVVAHGVSVMVVQAGAARRLLDREPSRAEDALLQVEAGGRDALADLRRMLGLLTGDASDAGRPDGAAPPAGERPGLDQLDGLAERMRAAGVPVELRVEGPDGELPAGLELAAYRVVQEALTNVLRHAPGATARVEVARGERELRLEVLSTLPTTPDAGPAPAPDVQGAGRGLVGMRERVAAYGGELDAGPGDDGGFAVRARFPLDPLS